MALMQLNMTTSNYINEHEYEISDMMFMINKMKEANKTK